MVTVRDTQYHPERVTVPLLHVTDCFPPPRVDPAILEEAAKRGTAVHQLTEKFDKAELGKCYEGEFSKYLDAWIRFRIDTSATPIEIEYRIGGPKFGYIGTLDRIMEIPAKRGTELWVVDVKSGGPFPLHGPQTAAYEHCYRLEKGLKKHLRRACVHLDADGTYAMKEHKDPHDYATFLAYLRIAKFEIEHGLRPTPKER